MKNVNLIPPDVLQKREALETLQSKYLDAGAKLGERPESDSPLALADYKAAWQEFRTAFCDYHAQIKQHFKPVEDKVAKLWAAAA